MPDTPDRDAQVVAALRYRLVDADPATWSNFAWFAARRGERSVAFDAARTAVAMPGAPRAAWRAVELLAAGHTDGLLLTDRGGDPDDPAPTGNPLAAAVAAHCQRDVAAAEACYRAALPHPLLAGEAWNGLAVLHEERRESVAADSAWERAVEAGSAAALHNQALATLRRGFPHRARLILAPALAAPGAPASVRLLAGYAALCDHDPAVALPLVAGVVAGDPGSARGHFTLGLILERLGQPEESLAAIRRALELSPWYRPQTWLLAPSADEAPVDLPVDEGHLAGAGPTDEVQLALGRSLLQTGQLADALAAFDQVLARHPAQAVALFHRGVVLAKLRRYPEALEAWETVGHADPTSELADASLRHARSARHLATLFGEH